MRMRVASELLTSALTSGALEIHLVAEESSQGEPGICYVAPVVAARSLAPQLALLIPSSGRAYNGV